jgi:hypothetical protein
LQEARVKWGQAPPGAGFTSLSPLKIVSH